MKLKIDRAGRIVLPKPTRDRLGLRAGTDLELVEGPDGVTLRPIHRRSSLVRKGRFLIHTGVLPAGCDVLKAIEDDREQRLKTLARQ
jgi:AbrB family looped-hinge helix DNA binding protein